MYAGALGYSGTAAGSQYGVAKAAHLIAVKVLSDAGCVFNLPQLFVYQLKPF